MVILLHRFRVFHCQQTHAQCTKGFYWAQSIKIGIPYSPHGCARAIIEYCMVSWVYCRTAPRQFGKGILIAHSLTKLTACINKQNARLNKAKQR